MAENLPLSTQLVQRSKEALVRTVIWSFIGTLYGLLFMIFYSLADYWQLSDYPVLVAGTLSGTIAAMIYSSMRLAVIITPVASVASIAIIISHGHEIDLFWLVVIVGVIGAITGAIYGLTVKTSRIYRADAKTLTGIASGTLAAVAFTLIYMVFPGFPLTITIGLMCLLTGSLYVAFAPGFVNRFTDWLPPVGDGALSGCGTAVFVALLMFVLVTAVTPETAGAWAPMAEQVRDYMPQATLGGLFGGGISGFLSGVFLRDWQDL